MRKDIKSSKDDGEAREPGRWDKSGKARSLFLVTSYDSHFKLLREAIEKVFNGEFSVLSGDDERAERILDGICCNIKEVDFGIVVLGGIKKDRKGKNKSVFKMNIPFELGMLLILDKPVMYIHLKNAFDLNKEFSDIRDVQLGKGVNLPKTKRKLVRLIREKWTSFLPRLIEARVDEYMRTVQTPSMTLGALEKFREGFRKVEKAALGSI